MVSAEHTHDEDLLTPGVSDPTAVVDDDAAVRSIEMQEVQRGAVEGLMPHSTTGEQTDEDSHMADLSALGLRALQLAIKRRLKTWHVEGLTSNERHSEARSTVLPQQSTEMASRPRGRAKYGTRTIFSVKLWGVAGGELDGSL